MTEDFDEAFWDERYRSKPALWSGKPNVHLLEEASELTPGRALDVGSGEGADAIWLAGRGWQVTALDFSRVALARGAEAAVQAGLDITWQHADLTSWQPGDARYDLVNVQYLHLPSAFQLPLFDRLASVVAPGGCLLVVAHHPLDLHTTMGRPARPDLFYTGEDLAPRLGAGWEIVTNRAAPRTATDPHGTDVTIHDTVFRALRR